MEAVALAYRFPPSELADLDIDDLESWGELARQRLQGK